MQQFLVLFTCALLIPTDISGYPGTKRIANEYVFAAHTSNQPIGSDRIRYQCSSSREIVLSAQLKFYANTIGMGKAQNQSQLYFVVAGTNLTTACMSKISIHCNNDDELLDEMVCFNKTSINDIAFDVFVVDTYGKYAIGFEQKNIFFYDLVNLQHSIINVTWPNCTTKFTPYAADVSIQFAYLIGSCIEQRNDSHGVSTEYIKRIVYLLTITVNNNQYEVQIHDLWLHESLYTYSKLKFLSISVNNDVEEKILVGFSVDNTVHLLSVDKSMKQSRLRHISSKQVKKDSSDFSYGRSVAWLNHGQKAVVSYDPKECDSSKCFGFFVYDMTNSSQFTNKTVASYTFPNENQQYPVKYEEDWLESLVATPTNPSSVYMYGYFSQILVILPSKKGYYSTNYELRTNFSVKPSLFFLLPNVILCLPGTYKNDAGIWPCSLCETTMINTSQLQSLHEDSINLTCPQCSDKESCPLQFIHEVDDFPDIEQTSAYPEASEMNAFDDILLYQMFRTDCPWNSPFYFSLICLFIILLLSILISLLKLYKHFTWHYRHLTRLFQRVDFIEQGQFCFGGLLTILAFVLLGFAIKFSHLFHSRYPTENGANMDNDTCLHSNQLNAKFETSLQFVGSSPGQHREIFHLLDSQQFTLSIELINTFFHSAQLTIHYTDTTDSLPFFYHTSGRVLFISVNLTTHNSYLKLDFTGKETIDAIRIGITGPNASTTNNYWAEYN